MNRIVTGLLVMLAVFILLGTACSSGRQPANHHSSSDYIAPYTPAIYGQTQRFAFPFQG